MFGALRKKISGWLKKKPEEKEVINKSYKKAKKKKAPTEKELKKSSKKIKELPIGQKYSVPAHKYEPNLEKLEELKEEPEKKQSLFSKLIKKISSSELTQEQFDEIFEEIEITLLENNVALEVVDKIKSELSKDLVGVSVKKGDIEKTIIDSLKNSILSVITDSPDLESKIALKKESPYTILFFGINGSGKTTTIAKLAYLLSSKGISVVLGAGDTFRAASIEQLQKHGEKIKVKVISQKYGSDPAAVAFDTIAHAKKNKTKVALIDTAGRMYTKTDLLKEMEKIVRVAKPDLKIFVAESITGNDAIEQAKKFDETVGIDGIILTKADIDEKTGTILSISYITKKPIYFLGTGQKYSDLQKFTKSSVLKNLGLEG